MNKKPHNEVVEVMMETPPLLPLLLYAVPLKLSQSLLAHCLNLAAIRLIRRPALPVPGALERWRSL